MSGGAYQDPLYGQGGYGGYHEHYRVPPPQEFSNYGDSGDGSGSPSYGQGGAGQFGYGQGYPPTLLGILDGVNAAFSTGVVLRKAVAYRNGVRMTLNVDVVAAGQYVIFLAGQIPQPGDLLVVLGWV